MNGPASMFDRLVSDAPKDAPLVTSTGGPDVSDLELQAGSVPLLIVGLTRDLIEGGPSTEPMEVWHAMGQGVSCLLPRTIRGRRDLSKKIMYHARNLAFSFSDARTGESTPLPGFAGGWVMADRDGAPAAILCKLALDPTAGKLAGKGRGFAYLLQDVRGIRLAQARATYPELAQVQVGSLCLALPDGQAAAEAAPIVEDDEPEAARPPAKAKARRS